MLQAYQKVAQRTRYTIAKKAPTKLLRHCMFSSVAILVDWLRVYHPDKLPAFVQEKFVLVFDE